MNLHQLTVVVLAGLLFFPSEAGAARKSKASSGRRVTAKAAILWDSSSGKRLYGKHINQRVQPASTTKVMTALLVLERLPLDAYVTVPPAATQPQPSKLFLHPGDKYRVRDLLYAILLNSANDASVVLAYAVAGSEQNFVQMMNDRARKLGAHNTKFANSHGLPSKQSQYSTPYDMSLILREALKNDFFRQAITSKFKTIYSKDGRKHILKSHNKMLFKGWNQYVYGKTGYTRLAQSCFVGFTQRGKRELIVAVFGATQRWQDIKYIVERYGGVDL